MNLPNPSSTFEHGSPQHSNRHINPDSPIKVRQRTRGVLSDVGHPNWRRAWDRVIPFFAFPLPCVGDLHHHKRDESLNARLRKISKMRGHFPSDDAATKLI